MSRQSKSFQKSLDDLNAVSWIRNLNEDDEKKFWDRQVIDRLKGMHSRITNWETRGLVLRVLAFAAGAVVTGLAAFSGLNVRIATVALAALTVTLNGVVNLLHPEQRMITNRRYEGMLLSAAWSFALKLSPYDSDDAFATFVNHVNSILTAYDGAYETAIYVLPTATPDGTTSDSAQRSRNKRDAEASKDTDGG